MKSVILITLASTLLFSCGGSENGGKKSKESYTTLIDSLEGARKAYFDKNHLPPRILVLESLQAYEFYAADYPEDEKSANYLFESAKRYEIDLNDNKNAIRLYKEVYDKYPDYENHAMALFHIGNAYHSDKDNDNAIKTFKEFMEKYPNHDFADDAEGMINIIEMGGEEEFLRRIMEQAKQDSVEG